MRAPPNEKRKILGEILGSLSKDPLSIQFLAPWLRSLLPGRTGLTDGLPWMTFGAIRWLRSYLRPTMTAFEYGAGGSTLFIATRVRSLTSVENDAKWYALVSRALRERGITHCDLRLVPAEPRPSIGDSAHGQASFTTPELPGYSFEAYVRTIEKHPDRSLDLVAIDGYARLSCIARSIPKVRRGGHVLLDNSDWDVYQEGVALLAEFPRRDFRGVGPFQPTGWQTSIWKL